MPDCLKVVNGARVMLMRNVSIAEGLVNGAFGTVVRLEPEDSASEVKKIYVKFDQKTNVSSTDMNNEETCIGIEPYEENMSSYRNVKRQQFPLKLGWAATIHKCQGMTKAEIVFDMDGIFAPGQSYVALSRATSLDGMYIDNYNPAKIFRNDQIHENLKTMQQHPEIGTNLPESSMTILLQNIQGLQSKIELIQKRSNAMSDVMLFNETLLRPNQSSDKLQIDGYNLERKERANNTGRGGLAAFIKNEQSYECIDFPQTILEFMAFLLHEVQNTGGNKLLVILLYRSPSVNITDFKQHLIELLTFLDQMYHNEAILICGDFNENLLNAKNHAFHDELIQNGFTQHVQSSTTMNGTLLDAVYTKNCNSIECQILPTYYSDHEAVKILFLNESHASSHKNDHIAPRQNQDKYSAENIVPPCPSPNKAKTKTKRKSTMTKQKTKKSKVNIPQGNFSSSTTSAQSNVNHSNYEANALAIPITGMRNLGNTCYANSVLQVLINTPSLNPIIETDSVLSKYLKSLKLQRTDAINPEELFHLPQIVADWPGIGTQQDAHEFLFLLLQLLHQEEIYVRPESQDNTAVKRTVYAELCHLYTCLICGNSVTSNESVNFLSSPIKEDDTNEITIEPSDEESDRPCTACGNQETICDTELIHAPPVLFITIMRFNNEMEKIHSQVLLNRLIMTKRDVTYELTSVINHEGVNNRSGHYYVDVKEPNSNCWYRCDDHRVKEIRLPQRSPLAYVLVYQKLI